MTETRSQGNPSASPAVPGSSKMAVASHATPVGGKRRRLSSRVGSDCGGATGNGVSAEDDRSAAFAANPPTASTVIQSVRKWMLPVFIEIRLGRADQGTRVQRGTVDEFSKGTQVTGRRRRRSILAGRTYVQTDFGKGTPPHHQLPACGASVDQSASSATVIDSSSKIDEPDLAAVRADHAQPYAEYRLWPR